MEKIKDFLHDFSDIFFAIVIAGVMFAVLTLNLGNWFDDFPNTTILANESTNIAGKQNSSAVYNKSDNKTDLKNEENQSETEYKNDTDKAETDEQHNDKTQDNASQNDGTQGEQPQDNNDSNTDPDKTGQDDKTIKETKRITIPSGTFGTGVAKILKENGLINDINDFVRAAENLNLSSRLKSGSFEIPTDATAEDMARIIAGQKNM